MAISDAEQEQIRRRVEQWRYAGPILDEIKTRELRALTEEEARASAEGLLAMMPSPHDWSAEPEGAGMVEQQRWFMKAAGRDSDLRGGS